MEAGSIKAIDRGSVHRICSGQVVLTLATAVKELVENSIDAGATIVDVKLKEYGSEMIEVTDNGSGVEDKNFEGLTLKHHTSKLEDFSDLINVETFGFRGEALSSLCALSDLCIVSRHKTVEVGTKLVYDHHGKVSSKTAAARQVGTTVTLQNLFYTLPVRHKEFQRNLKKEFVKMVQVLNAYCLVNTGVRISCTNQTGKGNKTTVVSSKGNPTIKDNISNIFGPKQVQSLLEFKQSKPTEEVSTEYGVKCEGSDIFRLDGYVSKCEHGQGRSSADRQFYFINKRPCDHAKISKLVNEVYHQYNRHQYPFVALSIGMCKESVDVNVTPDKRQIFIENEKILLAVIKTSLIEMFEPTSSVYNIHTPDNMGNRLITSPCKQRRSLTDSGDTTDTTKPSIGSAFSKLKRTFSSNFAKDESGSPVIEQKNKQRKLDNFVVKSNSPTKCSLERKLDNFVVKSISPTKSQSVYDIKPDMICVDEEAPSFNLSVTFENQESVVDEEACSAHDSDIVNQEGREIQTYSESLTSSSQEQADSQSSSVSTLTISSDEVQQLHVQELKCHSYIGEVNKDHLSNPMLVKSKDKCDGNVGNSYSSSSENIHIQRLNGETESDGIVQTLSHDARHDSDLDISSCVQGNQSHDEVDSCSQQKEDIREIDMGNDLQIISIDEKDDISRKERKVLLNLQSIKDKAKRKNQKLGESFCRTFRAKISPSDNTAAEEELQKEIKKDMFKEMEILGQFNLGFIITKLKDDLFIVDQHATDEKYNFEMLQRHTVLQSQKLIQPQTLELTSSNEIILMENIDVFRKNGFDFVIDEEADPTQRVKLISSPVSKNWTFGKDDIEELIFMLTDSPGIMCRPSRVRAMFASRSCRKSIMIGTALNKAEMKKLVVHMGEIEQPWNCPHGRPTMRHLINVNMVPR